jgi:hypothetical protein
MNEFVKNTPLIPYRRKDLWGYSDWDSNIIIECQFEKAEPFSEGLAVVQSNGLWAVLNVEGILLTNFLYEDIGDCKNGFASIKRNGKWGFINKEGKEQIPPIYDDVLDFSHGRAAVKLNGVYGFIDEKGNPISKLTYEICDSFENGYASVKEDGFHGAIDMDGFEVVPCISSLPVEFSEGIAAISLIDPEAPLNSTAQSFKDFDTANLIGYEKGDKIIFEDHFGNIYDKESMALASMNHRCGYVNGERQTVIEFKYDMAFPFSEWLACVCINLKYGFIDKKGDYVILPIYEDAGNFKEGVVRVRKNGKWGFINRDGTVFIDFLYEKVWDFNEGYAKYTKVEVTETRSKEIQGVLNEYGQECTFPSYFFYPDEDEDSPDFATIYHDYFSEGRIAIWFSWSDGIIYIDQEADEINEFPFYYIDGTPFLNGIAKVKYKKHFENKISMGFIDYLGNEYWED